MGRPPKGEKAMTNAERQAAWKARNKQPRELDPCGSRGAYVRHLANGEEACQACLEANRRENAENYVKYIKPKRAAARAKTKPPA